MATGITDRIWSVKELMARQVLSCGSIRIHDLFAHDEEIRPVQNVLLVPGRC